MPYVVLYISNIITPWKYTIMICQSKLILKASVYCWFETTSHYADLELISFYHSLLSSPFRSLLTCLFRVLFCFCSFAFWEEKLHCSVLNSQKSDTGTLPPTQSLDAHWLFGSWRIEGMYFSVSLFPNYLVPDTVSVLREWRPMVSREVFAMTGTITRQH